MSSDAPPPAENQISPLPNPKVLITSHNGEAKAVVTETEQVKWTKFDEDRLAMSVIWTTQFPSDLNSEADIKQHKDRMARNDTGLVLPGGSVLRYVDLAPGYECMMHRTQSLDYATVTAGNVVAKFDSGEEHLMRTGDILIQRATMHSWKNPSETEWTRLIFCLQDVKPLFVGGEHMKEAGVEGTDAIPPSGNDK